MDNLQWFTGDGEMAVSEVANMSFQEIVDGINNIGVDPEVDIDALAREIMELARASDEQEEMIY